MLAAVEGDDAIEAKILHTKRPKLFRQIEPSLIMDKTNQASWTGIAYVSGFASGDVLAADLELSFWGGIDPWKGEVIDRHHPLSGRSLAGKILAIPGGRGSCSGSGVMLELLLNGKGPAAMLFEREDDILTLGVLIGEELFGQSIPVVTLTPSDFRHAMTADRLSIAGPNVSVGSAQTPIAPAHERIDLFDDIELDTIDRDFLSGACGDAGQIAMRIIIRMARLQGARKLINVSQVHIDGCVYTGPGCLAFAEKLRDRGGKVVVPTTLNSISVDQRRWQRQGIDPTVGEPASKLGDVYTQMGAKPTFTCAPYLLDSKPQEGEQIAWAESNAVVFANSVLGARTMKYPDFLDICIALTGRAPLAGPHIDANRKATLRVRICSTDGIDDAFYPLLGYKIGALSGNRIPLVEGLQDRTPNHDDLKAFGAAFATLSSAPMFHILGVTPEASTIEEVTADTDVESVEIRPHELAAAWGELNSASSEAIDLVSLGNPHFSFGELQRLSELCGGRTKSASTTIIVTTGRAIYERALAENLVQELEAFGVQFVTDTCWCMIADPVIPPSAETIMTNSGKYAHYGPGITGRNFRFGNLADCVHAACTGYHGHELPRWVELDRG